MQLRERSRLCWENGLSWLHGKKNHGHTDDPEEVMGFDC